MGWLIDPEEKTVFVYQPKQEVEIFDEMDRQLLMPGFAEGLQLRVGELFDWLIE
jgi:Uma2 family endonuclease